jgi:DNA-binding MarR family transcriptional regulator
MLLEASRAVDAEVTAALADRGASDLTPGQAAAMLLIDRTGTRLTDLAEQAQITKQAMMQVVDDLEALGYVRRAPDPRDARAKVVRLTPRGTAGKVEARRAMAAVEGRIRRRLGESAHESLRRALGKLGAE